MNFELYYSTGGHRGPYPNLVDACLSAKRLLASCPTLTVIEIRPRNSTYIGGYGDKHKGSFYYLKQKTD